MSYINLLMVFLLRVLFGCFIERFNALAPAQYVFCQGVPSEWIDVPGIFGGEENRRHSEKIFVAKKDINPNLSQGFEIEVL